MNVISFFLNKHGQSRSKLFWVHISKKNTPKSAKLPNGVNKPILLARLFLMVHEGSLVAHKYVIHPVDIRNLYILPDGNGETTGFHVMF